jgi:ABC-type bacteriocin/lantibiotic exporter with double-glycine peptidase domain
MVTSSATRVQEAAVSRETAISCLTLFGTHIGVDVDIEKDRSQEQSSNATLTISELIRLANEFSFEAHFVHRDWPWLLSVVAVQQPILLILRNGNTILALGTAHSGTDKVVVSDPL